MAYQQLEEKLKSLAKQSPYISLETIGKTASGLNLYCVIISKDAATYNLAYCQTQAHQMITSPKEFLQGEKKVPIMINASLHGSELSGTNAVLHLIERIAIKKDKDILRLLENIILLCAVCANPEGRKQNTRYNGNGFDLNRDFITQSQEETKAVVQLISSCNPLVFLDLHGYVNKDEKKIGLIEPCTPPHNPNYEYDLYEKWAFPMAQSIESYLLNRKDSFQSDQYKGMTGTFIPFRDSTKGWDDYGAYYAAMYAMLHGTLGVTIEAPTRGNDGELWLYYVMLAACEFVRVQKSELLQNILSFFYRGTESNHPHHAAGFFPEAYIIPVPRDDASPAYQVIDHLIKNGVSVEIAEKGFIYEKKVFLKGTFIIQMNQPKAVLANTFLWTGENLSNGPMKITNLSAWSLPLLWGAECIPVKKGSPLAVKTTPVSRLVKKYYVSGDGPFILNSRSIEGIAFIQKLLAQGISVKCTKSGEFLIENKGKNWLRKQARGTGLTLRTGSSSKSLTILQIKKAAIIQDNGIFHAQSHAGTKEALKKMGFQVKEIHPRSLTDEAQLKDVDVLIYSGVEQLFYLPSKVSSRYHHAILKSEEQLAQCKETIIAFIERGGRFIGIGAGAARAAKKSLGVTNVGIQTDGSTNHAILNINYLPSPLTYGYSSGSIGFVYRPVWFTNTKGAVVAATYSKASDSLISGYWPGYEKAQGQPVIIAEKDNRVILIGMDIGFRQYPSYLYGLLANAIYL
ncbi:M14 family zinc carboxypeptidase [Bacillus sp. DTU_2020_1000418_1_SI_GHA_SEK_038]|uniref:M14 family zinc carboxypeptidase n=1 Tax=Bacillus sp. DTU_2020_1000418_1_SI_GHA_SEK_038 TaxID=3077585 RepID=UPI0028E227C7|nr:M14 family zinc carboxypeptidase [Bacillus sp. DTU_2020_1000418_1_SI_GHA_SEK_038]WNS75306.1 M14 family zinc carboxypeptidase [Bacillus sp. DTU_2020_1000418_1_SI_GHA_SEK_038]